MPKVSVIMAVYNCEKTIKESIDSILSQTYTDWEFIICDDCSSDSTYGIVREYETRYPGKIILIQNNQNSKLPYSLNHCLKFVHGEYVARMDGDDISTPDRLEKQVAFLDDHPELAVCGTDMMRFDENGEYSLYHSVVNPNKYTLLHEVPYCHATIMMRAEAYRALNGYTVSPRTVRGQDVDLWFRFYAAGFQGDNIHEALYKVREDQAAIRRAGIRSACYVAQTRAIGFRMLNYPKRKYYLVLLPIISEFVPRKIKLLRRELIHKKKHRG